MIEIAISLAVIGFALAAIIGILPYALNVQRDNREETIVNQDAQEILNAIRNGERGLDDLTNYVINITKYWQQYPLNGSPGPTNTDTYTPTGSSRNGSTYSYALTNGFRIIGLLSTPKFVPYYDPVTGYRIRGFYSNYVVANFRALSGPASEKYPQSNQSLRDLSFSYRLVSEVVPFGGTNVNYDTDWTNFNRYVNAPGGTNSLEYINRRNFFLVASNLQTSLHDTRLIFRWPLFADQTAGNNRQVFRGLAGGHLAPTNEIVPNLTFPPGHNLLFFFNPREYVKQTERYGNGGQYVIYDF